MWRTALVFGLIAPAVAAQQARVDQLGDPLPADARLRLGSGRFQSPASVMQMALSGDQKILITMGGFVTAWDAETGEQLWRESQSVTGIRLSAAYGSRAFTFEPDGIHFLTAAPGGGVLRWNARTNKRERVPLRQVAGGRGGALGSSFSIDVSPDGKLIAVGSPGGLTVVAPDGTEQYRVEVESPVVVAADRDRLRYGGPFAYARFAPDAGVLAYVTNDAIDRIKLLQPATGDELRTLACAAAVVRMDFSPDGRYLAVTERDAAVRLYEVATGERVWENIFDVDRSVEHYTSAICFSPDGQRLVVAERNQRLELLSVKTGESLGRFRNHCWNPWAIAVSDDGSTVYSSGWGGTIHRWNPQTIEEIPLPGVVRTTGAVAADRAGRLIGFADRSGQIHLVDDESGKQIRKLNVPDTNVEYIAFSPDCRHLAAGGQSDGLVHVSFWDYQTGELKARWDWPTGRDPLTGIEEIRFSADGSRFAAAAFRQGQVHLFEVADPSTRHVLDHPSVYGLDFLPDGKRLVSAGWDRSLRYWDVSSAEELRKVTMPDDPQQRDMRMYTVKCDPVGSLLTTTHLVHGLVQVFDREGDQKRGEIQASGGFHFGSTCFSADGLWFATGTSGGAIEVWDPWTMQKVFEATGQEDGIFTLDFGVDNRTLLSGADGMGYLWELRPADAKGPPGQAWELLCSDDSKLAYRGWWMLCDGGDQSVTFLGERLSEIRSLLDLNRLTRAVEGEERDRRLRLLRNRLARDQSLMRWAHARRAVSVLRHIGSDAAIGLLRELSGGDRAELSGLARAELDRIRSESD